MKVNDFKLEVFFEEWEFKAKYQLSASDLQSMTVKELLEYEPGVLTGLLNLWMGYTEVPGNPELRKEIAKLYKTLGVDQIIVHSGAEEASIFLPE